MIWRCHKWFKKIKSSNTVEFPPNIALLFSGFSLIFSVAVTLLTFLLVVPGWSDSWRDVITPPLHETSYKEQYLVPWIEISLGRLMLQDTEMFVV